MHRTQDPLRGGHGGVLRDAQQRILAAIAATLTDRLAAMGEDASGLYSYYARKLRHGALLGECDLCALAVLRKRVGQFRRVWEIGPGVGQLTAMLALDGHEVIAIDRDTRRYAAMAKVLDTLECHDPAARGRVSTRVGAFPAVLDEKDDVRADAVLVLNCAFTAAETEYRVFADTLPRFIFGLVDFPRLFTETANCEEWRQRARAFAEHYRIAAVPIANYQIPEESKHGELFVVAR